MDHADVSAFQAHVGAAETQQEQRQEQDGADNQQDLEALQRRLGHRRGRQRRRSARGGNEIRGPAGKSVRAAKQTTVSGRTDDAIARSSSVGVSARVTGLRETKARIVTARSEYRALLLIRDSCGTILRSGTAYIKCDIECVPRRMLDSLNI